MNDEEVKKFRELLVAECKKAMEKQRAKKTYSTGYGLNMNDTVKSISTIKNFMANASRTTCNEFLYGALQDAVDSMEKQIPKKPIDDTAFGSCPNCHSEFNSELVNEYDMKHCLYCGQALEVGTETKTISNAADWKEHFAQRFGRVE